MWSLVHAGMVIIVILLSLTCIRLRCILRYLLVALKRHLAVGCCFHGRGDLLLSWNIQEVHLTGLDGWNMCLQHWTKKLTRLALLERCMINHRLWVYRRLRIYHHFSVVHGCRHTYGLWVFYRLWVDHRLTAAHWLRVRRRLTAADWLRVAHGFTAAHRLGVVNTLGLVHPFEVCHRSR